jgi:hypothetical protein
MINEIRLKKIKELSSLIKEKKLIIEFKIINDNNNNKLINMVKKKILNYNFRFKFK